MPKDPRPVRPYGMKTKFKSGGLKVKGYTSDNEPSDAGISTDDIPKGKRVYYRDDDGKTHIVVLVGRFNKKVEVACFIEEEATPEQIALLESAEEVL